jgi:outer membrane protein OmpA-like peptidoglycan-associated protein
MAKVPSLYQFGKPGSSPPSGHRPSSEGGKSRIWPVLGLALLAGLTAVIVWRFHRYRMEMAQLRRQVEAAQQTSNAALLHASQAEASARQTAAERDQAEAAKAQSQQVARLAQQQAQAAQSEAAQARQTAEQYKQQREAELSRLQQALGQIAETRRTAMGVIMTLDSNSIRFDFDKAGLKPQYHEVLSRIAGVLMTLKGYRIYVYGYTDDIGTQAYNLKLSERRAETVREYLVKAGVDPDILSTKGYGKSDPRVPGNSPQARAVNRRVEIGIVDSTLGAATPVAANQ